MARTIAARISELMITLIIVLASIILIFWGMLKKIITSIINIGRIYYESNNIARTIARIADLIITIVFVLGYSMLIFFGMMFAAFKANYFAVALLGICIIAWSLSTFTKSKFILTRFSGLALLSISLIYLDIEGRYPKETIWEVTKIVITSMSTLPYLIFGLFSVVILLTKGYRDLPLTSPLED
ncbi:MAG: hypothetical protein H7Y13_16860 [Sphingobacteriaceae bacterium]|nr:hypothetical protein [Sphingobacteriaceae bacterium]